MEVQRKTFFAFRLCQFKCTESRDPFTSNGGPALCFEEGGNKIFMYFKLSKGTEITTCLDSKQTGTQESELGFYKYH